MPRFLAAFPRSFARVAEGGSARRPRRTHATVERRCAVPGGPADRVAALSLPAAATGTADVAAVLAPDALRGPGWFESSWELKRGCEVSEGLPGDLAPNDWLQAFCAAHGSALAAA